MGPGEVLDLDEVGAHRSDALELLRDLMHVVGRRLPAPVEIFGEEHVLGRRHGVLEQAMDEDHVQADELSPPLDLLSRDLPDVCDELQLQVLGLSATGAGA
jgi:hypothetical protein